MDKVFEISDLNPLHFVEKNKAASALHRSKHIADWHYPDTAYWWMQGRPWYQPWQTNDTIDLQITTEIGPINYSLVDNYEELVTGGTFTAKQASVLDPSKRIYELSFPLSGLAAGHYQLELQVGSPVVLTLVSNVFYVAETIEDTIHTAYKHKKLYEGIYFQTGFAPSIRMYATLPYDRPGSTNVVYPNQRNAMTILSSKPFNTWKYNLGSSEGVPDFLVPKFNAIFGCPDLVHDGRYYTRATEGAQFEFTEEEGYAMRGWSIELRDKFNRSGKIFNLDGAAQNQRLRVAVNVENLGFVTGDSGGTFIQVPDFG